MEYGTQVWTPDLNKNDNKKKLLLGRAVGILFGDQCMREEGFAETLWLQDSTSLIAWSVTNNIHRIR